MTSKLTTLLFSPFSPALFSVWSPLVMFRSLTDRLVCGGGQDPTLGLGLAEGTQMLGKWAPSTTLIPRQYVALKIPTSCSEHEKLQLAAPVQSPNSRTRIQCFMTTFQAEAKLFNEDHSVIWNTQQFCCLPYSHPILFSFMAVWLSISILTVTLKTMSHNGLNVPSVNQVSLIYLLILQWLFELSGIILVPVLKKAEKVQILGSKVISKVS